jgi:hypothetical protein
MSVFFCLKKKSGCKDTKIFVVSKKIPYLCTRFFIVIKQQMTILIFIIFSTALQAYKNMPILRILKSADAISQPPSLKRIYERF